MKNDKKLKSSLNESVLKGIFQALGYFKHFLGGGILYEKTFLWKNLPWVMNIQRRGSRKLKEQKIEVKATPSYTECNPYSF